MGSFLLFHLVVQILLAAYSTADVDDYQCHDLYEHDATTVGTVSSPFYGKRDYHNGLWCEYRITSPPGYRIKITFKDLDIDPSSGCSQDKLFVFGRNKRSILGIFCGSELPNPLLSNVGENEIRLLFQTDYMKAGRGFLLQYESSPHFTSVCNTGSIQCGNRNCYRPENKCDGVDDCGDGTDEENCGYPVDTKPEKCGMPPIEPHTTYKDGDRMVGGDEATPNSWPWQASLQMLNSEPSGHFCGGSLLNSQWVLTASHCVKDFRFPGTIKVTLGTHSMFKKTKYEQVRTAAKIIAFPDLEGNNILRFDIRDDITLIKLNAPVKFNEGVQPACLPELGWRAAPGSICYVTGWGETRGTGSSSLLKQQEQVVQPRSNCSYNEHSQICVEKPKNSPCHGDSGGPLNCKLGDKWFVFGVASFVTTTNMISGLCTGPRAMTVYAASSDKADWIRTIINKYS